LKVDPHALDLLCAGCRIGVIEVTRPRKSVPRGA